MPKLRRCRMTSSAGNQSSRFKLGLFSLFLVSCDPSPAPPTTTAGQDTVIPARPAQSLSQEQFERMWAWLSCDECTDGELASLMAMQNRGASVPFLAHYLRDTSSTPFRNMRRRFAGAYQRVQPTSRSEEEYVADLMANFRALVRSRSAIALGELGFADTLRMALDSAEAWDFREDERSEFQRIFFSGTSSFAPDLDTTGVLRVGWDSRLSADPLPPEVYRCVTAPAALEPPGPGNCYTYEGTPEATSGIVDNGVDRMYTFDNLREGVYEVRSNLTDPDYPSARDSTVLVLLVGASDEAFVRFVY